MSIEGWIALGATIGVFLALATASIQPYSILMGGRPFSRYSAVPLAISRNGEWLCEEFESLPLAPGPWFFSKPKRRSTGSTKIRATFRWQ